MIFVLNTFGVYHLCPDGLIISSTFCKKIIHFLAESLLRRLMHSHALTLAGYLCLQWKQGKMPWLYPEVTKGAKSLFLYRLKQDDMTCYYVGNFGFL